MKVNELAAKYPLSGLLSIRSNKKLLSQLACFGCGFIAAGGTIFGSYSPFGISAAAALPFSGVFSSLIGSVLGYISFTDGSERFRYIAAMLAVVAIRWTLNDIKKLNRHSLYAAAVCFLPSIATGFAAMSVSGFRTDRAVFCVLEAVIGAAAAYFLSRTIIILHGTKSLPSLLLPEAACLVLTGCVGILALSGIMIGPVSIGRIAAILCILIASRYGSTAGGAVSGISAGIVLSIASDEMFFIGSAYAFGGLISGIFSRTGRLVSCIVFTLSCSVVSVQSGSLSTVLTVFYECAGASAIFLLLPKSTGSFLAEIFSDKKKDEQCTGLRRSVIMRLDFASKALSDVSSDVEEVAQRLSKIVTPTLDRVYEKAVESTCRRCGLRVYCWEHGDGMSLEYFRMADERLRKLGSIEPGELCEEIKKKCCRSPELTAAINKSYKSFLASEAAAKRIDEVRSVVAGQFCGLGDILGEMADEYESYEYFDNDISDRIFMKLKELGLVPSDISCRVDHLGRMTVEAEIYDEDRKKINRDLIVREISRICSRRFELPGMTAAFGRCRLVLSEKPSLGLEIASSQHICGSGLLSGDNFRYFNDGMGRMVAVLSDGMGTGGRAAVDSGMSVSILSKLIKAGLGFGCSLKVVNSALLVKSGDESLSTLDVVSVDLFTGHTDFMKAGAALSFIRKNGEMYRVETPSLPVGILPDVEFTRTEDELTEDDIIVMISDGAVVDGVEWIERIIMKWGSENMQSLADLINDEATSRRQDGHDDDITVLAMRISAG